MSKYKIDPEAKGWVLYQFKVYVGVVAGHPTWVPLGTFATKELAEEALQRTISGDVYCYDKNGVAVACQ